MTPAEFRSIGAALFGRWWRTPLAAALDFAPITISRWAAGSWPVPDDIAITLTALRDSQTAAPDTADETAAWSINRRRHTARHASGIVLKFSQHPDGGWSGAVVAGLEAARLADPAKLVRLMRQGGDAWALTIGECAASPTPVS